MHVGTLLAVIHFFRRDIVELTQAWFLSLRGQHGQESALAWSIVAATIPAGLAGLLFHDFIETHLRSALVIAITTIVFGLLLGFADVFGRRIKSLSQLTLPSSVVIGLAQALALIPGTSRSGITMTAALLLGYERQAAARFSFLLSIPLITLSGGYKTAELIQEGGGDITTLLVGTLIAAISAWVCIHYFLRFIDKIGMWPFVIYRLLLGALLLVVVM